MSISPEWVGQTDEPPFPTPEPLPSGSTEFVPLDPNFESLCTGGFIDHNNNKIDDRMDSIIAEEYPEFSFSFDESVITSSPISCEQMARFLNIIDSTGTFPDYFVEPNQIKINFYYEQEMGLENEQGISKNALITEGLLLKNYGYSYTQQLGDININLHNFPTISDEFLIQLYRHEATHDRGQNLVEGDYEYEFPRGLFSDKLFKINESSFVLESGGKEIENNSLEEMHADLIAHQQEDGSISTVGLNPQLVSFVKNYNNFELHWVNPLSYEELLVILNNSFNPDVVYYDDVSHSYAPFKFLLQLDRRYNFVPYYNVKGGMTDFLIDELSTHNDYKWNVVRE